MKRYDMPKIEISYFEKERVETLLSNIIPNAAGVGNSGGGATVTTGVETLFGKK